ncbi:hypothetical protein EJB05_34830, partial [Eragrostis curvula]
MDELQIACSVERVTKVIKVLTNDQKEAVSALGLGSLLTMKSVKMRAALLKFLIDRYSPQDLCFHIGLNESFSLTHEDVQAITGLKNSGQKIKAPNENISSDSPAIQHISKGVNHEGFEISRLEEAIIFQNNVDDDFIRRFVLYVLGTLLIPVSTTHVPLAYYSLVRNVPLISVINWNELTLGFLRANLELFKDGTHGPQWPYGNLALIQYCYWEKVRPKSSDLFFCMRKVPLMVNWDEDTAFKRDVYDIAHGRGNGKDNEKCFSTPESKMGNTCGNCKENSKTLSALKKAMSSVIRNTKHIPKVKKDLKPPASKSQIRRRPRPPKTQSHRRLNQNPPTPLACYFGYSFRNKIRRLKPCSSKLPRVAHPAPANGAGSRARSRFSGRPAASSSSAPLASGSSPATRANSAANLATAWLASISLSRSGNIFKESSELSLSSTDDDKTPVSSPEPEHADEDSDFPVEEDADLPSKGSQKSDDSSVAGRVKAHVRKRNTPAKFRSPMAILKKGRKSRNAPKSHERKPKQSRKSGMREEYCEDDFWQGLTLQEKAAIHYVITKLTFRETRVEPIFRSQEAVVPAEDMRCLTLHDTWDGPMKYICNGIIDGYIEHMTRNIKQNSRERFFCPVRHGYMMSDDKRVDKCLEPSMRPTYEAIVADFFAHELVFFPMQVKHGLLEHWIVVVMNTEKQLFQVLDSIWDLDMYKEKIYNLRYGIARIASSAREMSPNLPENVHSWDIQMGSGVPKQQDGSSCALAIMQLMQHWNGNNMPIQYTKKSLHLFRKKLVAELIFSDANDNAKAKEERQNGEALVGDASATDHQCKLKREDDKL